MAAGAGLLLDLEPVELLVCISPASAKTPGGSLCQSRCPGDGGVGGAGEVRGFSHSQDCNDLCVRHGSPEDLPSLTLSLCQGASPSSTSDPDAPLPSLAPLFSVGPLTSSANPDWSLR